MAFRLSNHDLSWQAEAAIDELGEFSRCSLLAPKRDEMMGRLKLEACPERPSMLQQRKVETLGRAAQEGELNFLRANPQKSEIGRFRGVWPGPQNMLLTSYLEDSLSLETAQLKCLSACFSIDMFSSLASYYLYRLVAIRKSLHNAAAQRGVRFFWLPVPIFESGIDPSAGWRLFPP